MLTHYRLEEVGTETITLGDDETRPLTAITGDGTGAGGQGEIPMGLLGELVELFNQRYGEELGDTDMLKVASDVRDMIRESQPALAEQAANNSREDFVRDRDGLLRSRRCRSAAGRRCCRGRRAAGGSAAGGG